MREIAPAMAELQSCFLQLMDPGIRRHTVFWQTSLSDKITDGFETSRAIVTKAQNDLVNGLRANLLADRNENDSAELLFIHVGQQLRQQTAPLLVEKIRAVLPESQRRLRDKVEATPALRQVRDLLAARLSHELADFMANPQNDVKGHQKNLGSAFRNAVDLVEAQQRCAIGITPAIREAIWQLATLQTAQAEYRGIEGRRASGLLGTIHPEHGVLIPAAEPRSAARG